MVLRGAIMALGCQPRTKSKSCCTDALPSRRGHPETMANRMPYAESCGVLQGRQLLDAGKILPLPDRPPRYDDENPGVSFFRTLVADVALEGLTLPRTYFGRSEIRGVSFRGTDLSESTANWNNFVSVDCALADLSRADLRASVFTRVSFRGSILRGADLRGSSFRGCRFADADLTGAKLVRSLVWLFRLSAAQRRAVEWHSDPGPEPAGG
jgi:hypothetical protein